jgi:hypothetical protein
MYLSQNANDRNPTNDVGCRITLGAQQHLLRLWPGSSKVVMKGQFECTLTLCAPPATARLQRHAASWVQWS